ncbi:hypothetical protein TruAng_012090 [Truncatella angustata]|nr:hypothetical protein TruAng_012090 [Truncatella angustata]
MTDVAGVVLGVVALWQTCVQAFDTIGSGQRYGMDYEVLRIKLEVERIRLLNWGEAVGISDGESSTRLDRRLVNGDVNKTVSSLLGCIHYVFLSSDQLQAKYGLESSTIPRMDQGNSVEAARPFALGAVFKKSYDALRRDAKDRQRTTNIAQIAKWAINDKRKFEIMVVEIKGYNDSLESLFPGLRLQVAGMMKLDIAQSEDLRQLQLVQDATVGGHSDIAQSVSARIEELVTINTARTELLTVSDTDEAAEEHDQPSVDDGSDIEEVPPGSPRNATALPKPPLTEYEKRMQFINNIFNKKETGALTVSVQGPSSYSSRTSAYCYWGEEKEDSWWMRHNYGHVTSKHASFDMYWKKTYMPNRDKSNRRRDDDYDFNSEEGAVLFDVESYRKYEHVDPGTVTIHGFALEAWDYEEIHNPKEQSILVSYSDPGDIQAKSLLRRIHELQTDPGKTGWIRPEIEEEDLKQFMGQDSIRPYERDRYFMSSFFSFLNRRDVFVDFLTTSTVGLHMSGDQPSGLWNMLWQIIVGKELGRRMEVYSRDSYTTGFTARVLANVIVSDLWIRNVELVLIDAKLDRTNLKKPETAEEVAQAEKWKDKGNNAMTNKDYEKAIEFYTEAMKIDLTNAIYRCNRAAATYALERFEESLEDAFVATLLDPKYAKAWSRLGAVCLKTERNRRAQEAYQTAITIASPAATAIMKKGIVDAKAAIEKQNKALADEKDLKKKHRLGTARSDQEWDIAMKTIEIHSRVHGQQVEGLLKFAEQMKWPFINETRDFAEEAYSDLRGGKTLPIDLHDWLFGLILPGKWFSYKIMAALVLATPCLAKSLGQAPYYECGLSLPKRSYWRIRTVLGRILGCLPGVRSVCGWLGLCPPVEFVPPLDVKPCYVRLKSREVTRLATRPSDNDVIYIGSRRRDGDTSLRPDEEVEQWMGEIKDSSNWIVPEPPIRQVSTVALQAIKLKRDNSAINQNEENSNVYRAQLQFKIDDSDRLVLFNLYTNPLFISLPACGLGPKGAHEAHLRELHRYEEKNIWTVERIKDHTAEDSEGAEVLIINATGEGAEVMARAWCSERGKNAVVRRTGGPCFVCAEKAASHVGLGTGVLIWVSSD